MRDALSAFSALRASLTTLGGGAGLPEAAYLTPSLTTVRQDFPEFGRQVLDLLAAQLGGAAAGGGRYLTPELVIRRSTETSTGAGLVRA